MIKRIPVFYRPEMVADSGGFSPSASKPRAVVADWQRLGLPIELVSFTAASRDAFYAAHDPTYVDGVLDCAIPNGFGNTQPDVARSLPYTVGSIVAAAKYVMGGRRGRVACSPTSGFHHAGHASGRGFCTFNGLVIAALQLKRLGLAERVGILDLDAHHGDGTADIIKQLGLDWIVNVTIKSRNRGPESKAPATGRPHDASWKGAQVIGMAMSWLPALYECDIVLYQAGADMHEDDPLGGFLTTEQMLERDRLVFMYLREHNVPLVWNLAGGYKLDNKGSIEPVLALHRQTMQACVEVYEGRWPR